MLSRVASQLYWFGRYLERVECTARLIRVNSNLLLDLPPEVEVGWVPLVEILGLDAEFAELALPAEEKHVVKFLTLDQRNPSSLISCIASARMNLRSARDIIATEVWEQTNQLHLLVKEQGSAQLRHQHDFLTRIIMEANTITGLTFSVMSNDLAFQFMRLGANIERADMTTRILDIRVDDLLPTNEDALKALNPQFDNLLWISVLRSLSAYQQYRQHMRTRITGPEVVSYLLQDRRHPRSVTFCLDRVMTALRKLPDHAVPEQKMQTINRKLKRMPVKKRARAELPELLDDIQIALHNAHEEITRTYFEK